MSTTITKGVSLIPGGHNAAQIARREAMLERIRVLLAQGELSTVEVAAALNVPVRTAYGYLARLEDVGEAGKTKSVAKTGGKTWALNKRSEAADEHAQGARVTPARQIGMSRHWMDVALFGPAPGAAA